MTSVHPAIHVFVPATNLRTPNPSNPQPPTSHPCPRPTHHTISGGMKLAGGLAQGTVMMGAKGTLDLTKGAMNAGLGVGDVLTGGAMGNVAAKWKKVTRGTSSHETSKRTVG